MQAADYAGTEYGVTGEEVANYERKAVADHQRLKAAGKLQFLTATDLRTKREKTTRR